MNKFLKPLFKILERFQRLLISITFGNTRIRLLRLAGMKIGKKCIIHTRYFSTEPYLIDIGDRVAIADGVRFLTHDGAVWLIREEHQNIDIFGKIKVGDNTFIGVNTLILPNTEIGRNCIIGSGSVVRGKIPENTVAFGNPAKVAFKTSVLKAMMLNNKNAFKETKGMHYFKKKKFLLKHLKDA